MPATSAPQLLRGPSRPTAAGLALLAVMAAGALVLLLPPAAGPRPDAAGASLALRGREAITIGIANEPPYGYLDTSTGGVTGEAPEIARALLERLGVGRMEVVTTEFRSLIPGLRAGRFDVIAAGMYVTPARCRQVLFSDPTYRIGEAMLVQRGNPLDLHAYADVARHPTARLGVVAGSVEVGYAESSAIPTERLVILKDPSAAVDSLRAGHVDAYAGTALTVRDLLRKAGGADLALAEPFAQPIIDGVETWGYGAFAFRPQDRALRDAWNRALGPFVGSPEHLALVAPFGFTAEELPAGMTAERLCASAAEAR